MLASLTTVVSAGSYDNMELVANTTSDANGQFLIPDLPNGQYTLIAVNETRMGSSLIPYNKELTLEIKNSDENTIVSLEKRGSIDHSEVYSLFNRSSISGITKYTSDGGTNYNKSCTIVLLDSETKELVANTTSGLNGQFLIPDLPNGQYTLIAVNETRMGSSLIPYNKELTLEIKNSDEHTILSLEKRGSIDHSEVYSLFNRSSISGITKYTSDGGTNYNKSCTIVLLDSETKELIANTTSDLNGQFLIPDLPNGQYTLIAVNETRMGSSLIPYNKELTLEIKNSDEHTILSLEKRGSIDHSEVYSLFNRSSISGITKYTSDGGTNYNKSCTVVLLKEKGQISPPIADFSVNNTYGDCPVTVQFTDLSENATEWYWDFGDGTNSTEQNPLHTYDSVGFFKVKLTVSNPAGSDTERRINLVTSNLPDVNRTQQILFLVIGAEETYMAKQAVQDMGMEDYVDVYGSYRENRVEVIYSEFDDNINMSKYDAVFITWKGGMDFLGSNLKLQVHEMINETNPGTFVYDHNYDLEDFSNINYVNHTEHPYLEDYWLEQYDNNIVRLITYLSVVDLSEPFSNYAGTITIKEPSMQPDDGIIHPDAGYEIFEDLESYLEWYADDDGTHHVYNPENYTVGVAFFAGHDGDLCTGITEDLIEKLESRGINVIPAFRPGVLYDEDLAEDLFKAEDEYKVNAFIDIGMGVSSMSSSVWHTEALQEMNVPVINGIQYQGTIEEWEETVNGQDGRFQYQIPIMEIGGEIEAIVIGGKEYNEELHVWTFETIDYQMDWMIDRTVRWMDLQHIQNKDKRVAIIYYNHGKAGAMVAANLDVVPSIPNFLNAMNESGYDMDDMDMNKSEFLDLVLQQGRNIGIWAPGELEYMVENYEVELLPVETYMDWFDELEPEAKQSVIDTWGEAPGKGMVYENESGQYFVFPKIEVGNVLIAPQPPRGLTINDTMLYHDQTIPPSHNYIAFYLWLNQEKESGGFDTDAVVHFGRHGTQEWLQGKGVGLSAKECWPAILIQDMPVVYLYDVGGVGEGITAKRRGNAVMVDHLTAPVISSGLYGNLTKLHDAMHNYETAEGVLKQEYKESIIEYYENLNFENDLGNSSEDLYAMNNETFDNFILYGPVHDYLHEIAASYMTYGFHILGEDMSDDGLIAMVKSMLGNDFVRNVNATGICDDPDDLNPAHSPNILDFMLEDVLVNGTDPMNVVIDRFNIDHTSGQYYSNVTSNASGEYNFSFVKDGKYTVYSLKEEHDGWLTGKKYVTVENGEVVSEVQLNLTKNATGTSNPELEYVLDLLEENPPVELSGTVEIFGQVTYSPMVSPKIREDAKLLLQQNGVVTELQLSNSTGNYTFTNVYDGEYEITALYQSNRSGSWYLKTKTIEINTTESTSINIDFAMEKDNEAGLVANSLLGEVSGTCLDETLSGESNCNVVLIRRMTDEQLTVVNDLYSAVDYSEAIKECTNAEVESMLNALDGKYIPPALGDDPTRSPDEVMPTGKNFYSFNPNIVPTKESWEMGKQLADEFLEEWKETHDGEYPEKIGFVLWSSESMRHKGVMESEVLYMLGVTPVWDSNGKVTGVELIPEEELGRPRIDVVVTMTGVYRDNWKWQIQLMDRAVRLASEAEDKTYDNYVKEHSDAIYDALMATGSYSSSEARDLSMCRLFGPDDGSWGIGGLTNAVDASGSWDDEEKLANLYIDSMGNIYGDKVWALKDTEVFKNVLANTEAVFFSRSGNSGRGSNSVVFDHTYEFFGGFGMAVRNVSGDTPEMFIVNLKDPAQAMTETLGKFLARELHSTYWNPEYIRGMMEHGYTGAGELDSIFEDFWGLNTMLPDEVTDEMWKEMYNVYIEDKYDLGLDEFFEKENPWAKQSMEARMLEAIRKKDPSGESYFDAPEEVIQKLVKEYVESVVENGVSCCHHTCGNPLLNDFVQGNMGAAGISQDTQNKFNELMYDATKRPEFQTQQPEITSPSSSSSSKTGTELKVTEAGSGSSNQTMMSGSGAGMDLNSPVEDAAKSTPDNYVEGYEMTKDSVSKPESSSFSFTGSDIVASVLVVAGVGAMYFGFWRRRQI
ncbi:cobaltochelatase subunit CobN [Methanolobus sp. ZRKC2]|uniref:cobaltochelatase subunit CobN n=1 Tax=Methanolobus sp. ZRKC2 TaxID=3125783 RepID=UPI0032566629